MALSEEAVICWFRERNQGPASLYRDYGVRLSVIDASVLIKGALGADEPVTAQVTPVGSRYRDVRLWAERGGTRQDVLQGRLTVGLVRDRSTAAELPADLAELVLGEIAGLGTAVGSHDPAHEQQALADAAAAGTLEGFPRALRVPYSACHGSGQMSFAGYVRLIEGLVDDFMADRGLWTSRLLAERGWVPAYARARIRLLGEAHVDEVLHAVYSVARVVGKGLFDGRIECHVRRGDRFVPTATGIVLHGYALADGPAAGQVAELDPDIIAAVTAQDAAQREIASASPANGQA
jgi:acyl-CoA thioesterase FadM